MKKTTILIAGLSFACIIILGILYLINGANQNLQVSVLQMKEDADCILLHDGDSNILIDTGESDDADDIISYLNSENVSKIDYMILTHYDKDHIGSVPEVIEHFEVENIIRPYYGSDSSDVEDFIQNLDETGINTIVPDEIQKYNVGSIKMTIYPPEDKSYNDDNNYSIVTLVEYGDVNMLFAGDVVKKRIAELMDIDWPEIDLYKVPHHGRENNLSEAFINLLKPEYAVVTSDQADSVIVDACSKNDVKLLYTGAGTVTFQCDGKKLDLEDEK